MFSRIYRHPSESSGGPPEQQTTTEENQSTNPLETPENAVAQLESELAAARSEAAQWHDRYLRKAAEFENFRKRMEKERADSAMFAKSSVIAEILPIVDACERALKSFSEAPEARELGRYREGVQLLYKQLNDTLTRLGVVPMVVQGEKFDPHLHEALSRETAGDFEENTIIEELRRGYLFNGRLLRPAQVKVAIRPEKTKASPDAS